MTYGGNFLGNIDTKLQLTLLTWMMDPPQEMERESQTRRDAYTNHNYHGTQSRLMHETIKSMRTIRRQEKHLGYIRVPSICSTLPYAFAL